MRKRCCTRSWTHEAQAKSGGSGSVVLVVVGGGVVTTVVEVGVVVVVVVVVVLLVDVVGGRDVVVVVVWITTGHRLRSCGSTIRSGTGRLETPSSSSVRLSSSAPSITTMPGPFCAAFPASKS